MMIFAEFVTFLFLFYFHNEMVNSFFTIFFSGPSTLLGTKSNTR